MRPHTIVVVWAFLGTNCGSCPPSPEQPDACSSAICKPALACSAQTVCPSGLLCDLSTQTCVQCLDSSTCSGTTPICSSTHTCGPCQLASDCPSMMVCNADGSCAKDDIAYVDSMLGDDFLTGDDSVNGHPNRICSFTAKCKTIKAGLATGKSTLMLSGTFNEPILISRDVTFDGTATLSQGFTLAVNATVDGVVIDTSTVKVTVHHLTFDGTGSSTPTAITIQTGTTATVTLDQVTVTRYTGIGVVAQSGTLVITRSLFSHNLGGGISADQKSAIHLASSIVAFNGTANSAVGGLLVDTVNAENTVDVTFNDFVQNQAGTNNGVDVGAAIDCRGGATLSNNLVDTNGTQTNKTQLSEEGRCRYNSTWLTPNDPGVPGTGNHAGATPLVDPVDNKFQLGNATSPAATDADLSQLNQYNEHDYAGADRSDPNAPHSMGALMFSSGNGSGQ